MNFDCDETFPDVEQLVDRHAGVNVFVMGTSGSLCELDLSLLNDQIVVATNDFLGALEMFDLKWSPQYLLTTDLSATLRAIDDIRAHPEVALVTRPRIARAMRKRRIENSIYVYDVSPAKMLGLRGCLEQASNTSHYAVEIAFRLRGCATGKIILVGVDLRYPTGEELAQGKTDHYWGSGEVDGCRDSFTVPIGKYPETSRRLRAGGVELVTVSPWDGPLLSCMRRVQLQDVVKESS